MEESESPPPRGAVHRIVRDLQALRAAAGGLSYAEIVRRVTALRLARGEADFLARPARTTVYDAFREGRTRLDADLVSDIAEALGGDGANFHQRCLSARLAMEATGRGQAPEDAHSPGDAAVAHPVEEHTEVPAEESVGNPVGEPEEFVGDPVDEPIEEPVESNRPTFAETAREHVREPSWRHRIALSLACLAINLLGYVAVEFFDLPIFLDMTGTGIAAIALGPWHGVAVALGTHLVGSSVHGLMSVPFVVVNIVGALIWGYGVRTLRLGDTLTRYFALTLAVAAACSAVATPILLMLFDGDTGRSASLIQTLVDLGEPAGVAVFTANIMTSVADKLISGFIILTVVAAVSERVRIPGGALFRALHPAAGGERSPSPESTHATSAPRLLAQSLPSVSQR